MRTHFPLFPIVLGLLALAPSAQVFDLHAGISSVQEVPTNPSQACATANLTYDPQTRLLTYDVQATGLAGTAAHIHDGDAGFGGPIIFILAGGPTSWVGTTAPLSAAQEADLLREGFYVNIHTAAFPAGEIRGQIVSPKNFRSSPVGALEVPPVATPATAKATFTLNPATGALTYDVEAFGLTATPTAAHIHDAPAGAPGGIVFNLTQTAPGAPTWIGTTAPFSAAQKIDLLTKGLYLNIHTTGFPSGEIRDQIHVGALNTDTSGVSVSKGCTQRLFLDAGPANGGANYWVVGSLSGTSPGVIAPGGVPVPVNPDVYFNHTLNNPNQPPLTLSMATLNASGKATCTFTFPAGAFPTLAGATMNHAYALIDFATGSATFASNATPLSLLP